jgi:hypothetical protein
VDGTEQMTDLTARNDPKKENGDLRAEKEAAKLSAGEYAGMSGKDESRSWDCG